MMTEFMNSQYHARHHRRSGFTLIELSVVLAILAIMTAVAMTALESQIDQARFDVTQRSLEEIDTAMLGPMSSASSADSRGFTGFVADIGRPVMTVGNDPNSGVQLAELWSNPRNLRLHSRVATSDPNIVIYSGWRGPYLRLPTTFGASSKLLDGFGKSFRALAADDVTVLAADQMIARLRSDGATTAPYNAPLFTGRSVKDWTGAVSGSIVDSTPATSGTLGATLPTEVRLFVPTASVVSGVLEFVRTFDVDGTDTSGTTGAALTGFQFQFPDPVHYTAEVNVGIGIGPKVLKISQAGKPPVVIHFWLPAGGYSLTERVDLH